MKMNSVVVIVLYSFYSTVTCYPQGAPDGACENMTPNERAHNGTPQEGQSPYKVVVDKPFYRAGQPVMVKIESSGADTFKGIFVQAREVGKNAAIGTFSDSLPSYVKHLQCSNPKGAITQTRRLALNSISLEWLPPSDVSGIANISFFVTVVKDKSTFWVKLNSPELYNMDFVTNSTTCPSEKCSAQTFFPNLSLFLFGVLALTIYLMV